MRFSWDADKARRDARKHGVSFEEAASALLERAEPFDAVLLDLALLWLR